MSPAPPRLAVAILVGGAARRLGGACKPLLRVAGQAILDRQLAVLRPLGARTFLVTGADGAAAEAILAGRPLEVVRDTVPGAGPLAGVHAALTALHPHELGALCVAGDLPFLPAKLVRALCAGTATSALAVAPRGPRGPEPLCAVYHRGALDLVTARLRAGALSLVALLAELDARGAVSWIEGEVLRALDPEGDLLVNVNSPEALRAAESRGSTRVG